MSILPIHIRGPLRRLRRARCRAAARKEGQEGPVGLGGAGVQGPGVGTRIDAGGEDDVATCRYFDLCNNLSLICANC